mgnify:CR=1 FL=1|tara:strand:+ start:5404 stop:6468 length:1065 start_codon:yes stop_codon:yes gene_type:complete
MRKEYRLKEIKSFPSVRTVFASAISKLIPNSFYKYLMESKHINFGIETTNICNANCSFCGYRYMDRKKTVMGMDVYKRAIDEYAASGGGAVNFTPTVGDPLVDKQIVKKIQYARNYKNIKSIFFYTNAILLNRYDLEEFLLSGITRLAISTYIGSKEGYEKFYGKDKYETVVKNILDISEKNQELGRPVHMTLHLRTSNNESDWRVTEEYKKLAMLIGETNITFLESYDAWSGLIKKEDLPSGCGLEEPLPIEEKKHSPCFELYRRVHVLSDGNVGACICSDLESEINIGNINDNTLDEIWKGEPIKNYRKNWVKGKLPDVCVSCTRYMPVEEFIENNQRRILSDYLRRKFSSI